MTFSALFLLLSVTVVFCHGQDYNNGRWAPQRGSYDQNPQPVQEKPDSRQNASGTSSGQSIEDIEFINGNCVYSRGQLNDNGAIRNLTEPEKEQLRRYVQQMDDYAQNIDTGIFQILRDFFSFGFGLQDDSAAQNTSSVQNSPDSQNQGSYSSPQDPQNNGSPQGGQSQPIIGTFPEAPCFCKSC